MVWTNKQVGSQDEAYEVEESEAIMIYYLIHGRYIQTMQGMKEMFEKYMAGLFERCPRVLCENELCIPYGESVEPGKGVIKFYCPRCQEVYNTANENKKLDGCSFGPYFANMFILQFPDIPNKPKLEYFPKLHGFNIHESSKNHPLYKYLVEKPNGKTAKIERPGIKYIE